MKGLKQALQEWNQNEDLKQYDFMAKDLAMILNETNASIDNDITKALLQTYRLGMIRGVEYGKTR